MEFIDKPTFGHTKFKLSVVLVPVIMFAVLIMGIVASKLYVSSVVADSAFRVSIIFALKENVRPSMAFDELVCLKVG